MTREEIVGGLKLLEDNMVYFDELQNDKGEWIDVHELLFETIEALSQEPTDTVSLKVYQQVCKERDIATEQLHELGYELGQKIEPCDDAISREAVIGEFKDMYKAAERWSQNATEDDIEARADAVMAILMELTLRVEDLHSVTQKSETVTEFADRCRECGAKYGKLLKQKSGHCKECKYFEYDSVAKVDGVPLIVAHEICNKWGNGCKTSEDGYCYLFEPQESEV
jgi:type VI protein secretion system component VasF